MKKILLLALSLGTFAATAQHAKPDGQLAPQRDTEADLPLHVAQPQRLEQVENGVTVWSEDFGNGFPAGWRQIDSSNINPWKWSLSGSRGFFNGTGAGNPSPGITSTTRTNGFLLNDPDSANHFTNGQPSGTTYQYLSSYVQTAKITSLGAHPFLKLEFEHHFRMNNEISPLVQVSNDSVTWTTYDVRGLTASNAVSADPALVSLNISSVAGGQNSVWIRFGWSSRVYYWMIDDIKIKTLENNNLVIEDLTLGNTDRNVNYAQLPAKQLTTSYTPGVFVLNDGAVGQPNTRLEASIKNAGGTTVVNAVSPSVSSFPASGRDTLETAPLATANLVPGSYWLHYNLLSDSVDQLPVNNRDSLRLIVGDTVMALDGHNKRVSYSGTNSFTGATDGLIFANYFELRQRDTITSVTVILSAQSRPGAVLIASVRDTIGVYTDPASFPVLLESDIYTLTRQDSIAGRAVIPIPRVLANGFNQNVVMEPGDYFIGVEMYSNNDAQRVRILDDESITQPVYASIIYIPAPVNPNRWYTNGNAWGIRANFNRDGAALALAKVSTVKSVKTYPNPQSAGSAVSVDLELEKAGNWSLEVYDAAGRLLELPVAVEMQEGRYRFNITTQGLSAGFYHLRLRNGHEVVNQKLSLF